MSHSSLTPKPNAELIEAGNALSVLIEANPTLNCDQAFLKLSSSMRLVILNSIIDKTWSFSCLSARAQEILVASAQRHKEQNKKTKSMLVKCEGCGSQVRSERIAEHKDRKCPTLRKKSGSLKQPKRSLNSPLPTPSLGRTGSANGLSAAMERLLQNQVDIAKQENTSHAFVVKTKLAEGKLEIVPGRIVRVREVKSQEEIQYYLYAKLEDNEDLPADVLPISTKSPVGIGIMKKFEGDTVDIAIPDGWLRLQIVSVETWHGHREKKARLQQMTVSLSSGDPGRIYSSQGRKPGAEAVSLDGSHDLGYLARDNGQWGSFPMHDDYGDESDADGVESE